MHSKKSENEAFMFGKKVLFVEADTSVEAKNDSMSESSDLILGLRYLKGTGGKTQDESKAEFYLKRAWNDESVNDAAIALATLYFNQGIRAFDRKEYHIALTRFQEAN